MGAGERGGGAGGGGVDGCCLNLNNSRKATNGSYLM